ncbi:hypothetical protein JI664_23660, partial [Rhodobacter sp. NTK016B]|uniref:hypothetical protein n=1 Tax=Rhodobacter sp. NTK016B TaxID=2759676 RepID=UPI001A8E5186
PSNDLQLSAIGFDIQDVSTNTAFLRLRLVLRPYDAGDYPTSWIAGQQAVDQHVCVVEVPIADVYQLTFPDKRQRVKINLDRVVPVPRGMMVLAEVTALQA